jgi:uncharacterized protein (TIGR03437 family)
VALSGDCLTAMLGAPQDDGKKGAAWVFTAPPQVRIAGVVNGASLVPGVVGGSWVTIEGTRLAQTTRVWQASDFVGNKLPLLLDGVSVKVNGRPAPVCYISPTQIYALAPDDPATGSVLVEVITPQGQSAPVAADKRALAPGWFMFDPEGRKYIAAVHPDGAYLGKPGLYAQSNFRPAKPGDIVLLFGTGFGPTSPSTPAGELVAQPGQLTTLATVRIGGVVADVVWAGLVSPGLYQFNVTVPNVPDGDQPVLADIGGFPSQGNAFITVQK